MAIGNHLGHFIHLEEGMLFGIDRRVGKILVEINMNKGFHEKVVIDLRDHSYTHSIFGLLGHPFPVLEVS